MAGKAPRSQDAFDAASKPGGGDTMALIIDIQGAGGMSERDSLAYFENLGRQVEALRARNIPITWVVMGDKNHLFEPQETARGSQPGRRDMSVLEKDMGFGGLAPGEKGRMIFHRFIRDHGPKTDEAIYMKFFNGAFVEPEDYAGDADTPPNPALRAHLENDYRKNKDGTPVVPLPEAGDYEGRTLTDYAQSRGVRNILAIGAVSTNCVTMTAISAIKRGFGAVIGIDGVLSWQGDEDKVDPRTSTLLWRGGDASRTLDDFHRQKINERLDRLTDADKAAWGITDADIESIRRNIMPVSEFDSSRPAPQTPAAPRPAQTPAAPVPP